MSPSPSIPEKSSTTDLEPVPVVTTQPAQPSPVVDKGWRAWLSVVGAFFALFATFGQMNAFGSFQLWYGEHQLSTYSPSDISWIGSLQLWVFFFSGGIIGRLFDAYGPRRLLALGTIIYPFSLMMTSLATKYYQFILAQGVLFGIGVGLLFYPSLSATQTHFMKYRATASGIAVAGSSVGGVIFPIMLQRLFNDIDFGWAVRVSGFICLACGIISLLTVTSRLPTRKPGPWIDVASFKDLKFMLFSIGSGICCFGIFIPFFYIVQHAQSLNISQSLSFDLLSVMNAGSVFGRILPGYMADYVGRYNLIIPFAFMSGLLSLALWLNVKSLVGLMFFAALYGFFSGAFISLNPPCIAQISKIEQIGGRVGLAYAILSFPSLVGGPIGGAILAHQGGDDYSGLIIFTGVTLIVGSLVCMIVKLMINRNPFAKV